MGGCSHGVSSVTLFAVYKTSVRHPVCYVQDIHEHDSLADADLQCHVDPLLTGLTARSSTITMLPPGVWGPTSVATRDAHRGAGVQNPADLPRLSSHAAGMVEVPTKFAVPLPVAVLTMIDVDDDRSHDFAVQSRAMRPWRPLLQPTRSSLLLLWK